MRFALVIVELQPDGDPPRFLILGPNSTGNVLEVVGLMLDSGELLLIHAMPLRRAYFGLLRDERP